MAIVELLPYGAALVLSWAAGALLLCRLLPRELDEEARRDAAVALGPVVGLLAVAFPGWLLSALLPVSIPFLALPLGGAAAVACLVWGRREVSVLGSRRSLVPAALVLGVFVLFIVLRLGMGDIRQTEKPMDAAVLSSLLVTPRLPLPDPWFAGTRFPYYHFGTFVQALPARAAGLAVEQSYNLIVALLAALAAGAAFGAVRLRGGGRRVALLGALVLVLAGTFDGARQLLSGTHLGAIDPWPSSRRVVNTITEWPLFTLWLGDLHPHAMSLPILVTLAGLSGVVPGAAGWVLDGALTAGLLSANPWDLPAAGLLLLAGALATGTLLPAVRRAALSFACAVPLLVPFLRSPRPTLQGLRGVTVGTTSPEAFLHFGALLAVPALALGAALVRSRRRGDEALFFATLFPALGIALAVVTGRPVLGLAVSAVLAVAYLLRYAEGPSRAGLLYLAAGATLVTVPEILVVADPYGEQFHRMNTVFKTYAAAAPLFALATALLLPLAFSLTRGRKTVRILAAGALLGALVQPVSFAVDRAQHFKGTLDGLAWMSREAPGDRAAIDYLRKHAPPVAVVAEAVGGAYDDHGRIGSFSGRPTVLGWPNHEGLWRGGDGQKAVAEREADVRTLYTSNDPAKVREILQRYRIAFVAVGAMERKDYGPEAFPLRGTFERVVHVDATELYRVGTP